MAIYNYVMAFLHKIWPSRLKPAALAILAFTLLAILAATVISLSQPKPVALTDPRSQQIAAVLHKAERLLGEAACNSSADVNVLDEVLADAPTLHRPEGNARTMVVQVYGENAAASAGFLTERKAFYLSLRGDYRGANATPANGLRPTARPSVYCPTPVPEVVVSVESVAIGPDQAITRYRVANYALKEATLVDIQGRWKIVDMQYLERNN